VIEWANRTPLTSSDLLLSGGNIVH